MMNLRKKTWSLSRMKRTVRLNLVKSQTTRIIHRGHPKRTSARGGWLMRTPVLILPVTVRPNFAYVGGGVKKLIFFADVLYGWPILFLHIFSFTHENNVYCPIPVFIKIKNKL